MKYLPNLLSLLRIPLAFAFFLPSVEIRFAALFTAMVSDFIDGYLARFFQCRSRLGASLDPLCDKFFVGVCLYVFFMEGLISTSGILCMFSRDIALFIFGLYLISTKRFSQFKFQAIWSGKLATVIQFLVILALTLNWHIPGFIFGLLALTGIFALIELVLIDREYLPKAKPPESP